MLTWNCNIIDIKDCDILYQVKYTRHCDNCGHNDNKERTFFLFSNEKWFNIGY